MWKGCDSGAGLSVIPTTVTEPVDLGDKHREQLRRRSPGTRQHSRRSSTSSKHHRGSFGYIEGWDSPRKGAHPLGTYECISGSGPRWLIGATVTFRGYQPKGIPFRTLVEPRLSISISENVWQYATSWSKSCFVKASRNHDSNSSYRFSARHPDFRSRRERNARFNSFSRS